MLMASVQWQSGSVALNFESQTIKYVIPVPSSGEVSLEERSRCF
jgi:hypothetical protein